MCLAARASLPEEGKKTLELLTKKSHRRTASSHIVPQNKLDTHDNLD